MVCSLIQTIERSQLFCRGLNAVITLLSGAFSHAAVRPLPNCTPDISPPQGVAPAIPTFSFPFFSLFLRLLFLVV